MVKMKLDAMEEKWVKYWKKEKIYKFNSGSKKKIYSIDTPPPYISGRMHIGHAFSYSQQDFIVRFRRMLDGSIFYPFGTDDNGLPSERFIERMNKVKSKNMSRYDFISLCLKTLKEETPSCISDFINLGISADFEIYYSTIDKISQKISQKSFVDLYKSKDIYKKNFPTLWCPDCQTSIAQAELEDKQEKSLFSTLKFDCAGKELFISTTRPELLGACVAIFVNPKDKRYKGFIGKKVKVPLFNFEVPVIGDDSAEIEKGTGAMMVCSYGDKYDVDAINRHKLTSKIIVNENGTLNVKGYDGLKIKEARKKILEDLEVNGLIKDQKEIEHVVNCHDKCGTEIEFLETEQWFVKLLDKKKKLVEQGKKINWYPKFMFKRYENWVNGLEWDWSISRNRHFGVPIPIWKCPSECGEIILPNEKELPVDPLKIKKICPKCKKQAVGESMVLDTWATSSMTPQIASELVGGKVKIPFSLRPQAHDIIRTWAFYTIAKSYLHEGKIPWKDIVISGFVKVGGKKMSKSKGTGINPQKILKEYGADALRFWAAGSKLGQDLDYQEKDLVTGKKMVNKLLNASRFVFINLEKYDGTKKPKKLEKIDELFLKRLNEIVSGVTKSFKEHDYAKAKSSIEDLFWNSFTNNYLEIVKKRVYQGEGDKKLSAQYTLYKSLLTILKLVAPIMPFVTEEIYQENFKKFEKCKSIHVCRWPEFDSKVKQEEGLNNFFRVLSEVRQEKTNNKKSMNSEIVLTLEKGEIKKLDGMMDDLKNVTNSREIKEGKKFRVDFI